MASAGLAAPSSAAASPIVVTLPVMAYASECLYRSVFPRGQDAALP